METRGLSAQQRYRVYALQHYVKHMCSPCAALLRQVVGTTVTGMWGRSYAERPRWAGNMRSGFLQFAFFFSLSAALRGDTSASTWRTIASAFRPMLCLVWKGATASYGQLQEEGDRVSGILCLVLGPCGGNVGTQ